MTSGWSEVDGIAAAAAAVGTLTLAVVTGWLAKRTHELAKKADLQIEKATEQVEKSAEQVEATRLEAEATEALAAEQRTDRQLAWRPQIERLQFRIQRIQTGSGQTLDRLTAEIRNSGAGPALDVTVLARDMTTIGRWWLIRYGDLLPGEARMRNSDRWLHGGAQTDAFNDFSDCDDRRVVTFVMLCKDVLDRRFRFGYAEPKNPFPGEPIKVMSAEDSTLSPEHPHHTGWAALPLIWG